MNSSRKLHMSKQEHYFAEELNYIFALWMHIAQIDNTKNNHEILLVSKRLVEEYDEESVKKAILEFESLKDDLNIEYIIKEVSQFPTHKKYRTLIDLFMISTLHSIKNQDVQLLFQTYQFDMGSKTILGLNKDSVKLIENIFLQCDSFFLYQVLYKILDQNYIEADQILKKNKAPIDFICFNNSKILNISEDDEAFDVQFLLLNIQDDFLLLNLEGTHLNLYEYDLHANLYEYDLHDANDLHASIHNLSFEKLIYTFEENNHLFKRKAIRNHSVYSFNVNTILEIDNKYQKYYLNSKVLKNLFQEHRDENVESFLYKHSRKNKELNTLENKESKHPYTINRVQAIELSCGYKKNKAINNNINFDIHSGELVAIMGPSGAGKSTLMKAFTSEAYMVSGSLRINTKNDFSKKYVQKIGYVAQDDVLINELSVYDNLYYNYRLHFGDDENNKIVEQKISTQLRKLGIYNIKNSKIYKNGKYQISGGQRKRLNIAMELIKNVDLILIDEPTSGLSSVDSEKIISLLKSIVKEGKIIITVIHQPSSSMYQKFNQVILFNQDGQNIYTDKAMEALRIFKIIKHEHIYDLENINDYEDVECPTCQRTDPELLLEVQENEKNNFWNLMSYMKYVTNKNIG